jgi:putative PIN family toxin of toxin-antitoxin system
MNETPDVVYDCMIFLQAAARPDRVHGTMRLMREGRVRLCLSREIVAEVHDVLNRPEVRGKFPALKPDHIKAFLDEVLARAKIVEDVPSVFSLPRDAKDEPYLNLAIEAKAKFLVTWNEKHLTYLMRKDTTEGQDFCARFPNLTILDPPTFVSLFDEAKPEAPQVS